MNGIIRKTCSVLAMMLLLLSNLNGQIYSSFSVAYISAIGKFGSKPTDDILKQDLIGTAKQGMGLNVALTYQFKDYYAIGASASINYLNAWDFKFSNTFASLKGTDIPGRFLVFPLMFTFKYLYPWKRFKPYISLDIGDVFTQCKYDLDPLYTANGKSGSFSAWQQGLGGGLSIGSEYRISEEMSLFVATVFLKAINDHAFDKNAITFNSGFYGAQWIGFNAGVCGKLD